MTCLARVTDVQALPGRVLRVSFSDGLVRELDFREVLIGALAAIDDDRAFSEAHVDKVAGTVAWPNGIDLDPDVLHGDEPADSARQPRLVREYTT